MGEIKVSSFKKALEIVKPGLATKEKIEQTASFAFLKNKVVTYNDEICLEHPLEGVKLKGAIKADSLYQFLSKVKTESIKIEVEEEQVLFKSGRTRVGFNLESEIVIPLEETNLKKDNKWKSLDSEFLAAISMARNCASNDMSDPKLVCVHINSDNYVEGSDGYRVLRYEVKHPIKTVLIPASSVSNIVKIAPTEVSNGKDWIHFRNEEGTILSCRVLDEAYVETESKLSSEEKGVKVKFPKELADKLETAEIFSKKQESAEEYVSISIDKNLLKIRSESESAWFEDEIEMEKKGKKFSFQVTPYLLQDILDKTDSGKIYPDRIIFKGENWLYVSALI